MRLPRNLHSEVHKVLHLRKLHTCHEISTWRFAKRCACHEICASRLTKCCAYENCTPVTKSARFTKRCACHEICTSSEIHKALCLPRNLHFEAHKVLRLPRNLHFEVHKVLRLSQNPHFEVHKATTNSAHRGSQSAAPVTKSSLSIKIREGHRFGSLGARALLSSKNGCRRRARTDPKPHVEKTGFAAPVTRSERLEDHHHVQSAAPATKSALLSMIPCTCHQKSTLDHQNMRFPLCLPRKVTTMSENARGHNESAVARSTRSSHPDFASLRSRNAHRGFREA